MQSQNLLKQPLRNRIEIGSIEIRVVSKPGIRVEELEGILKSDTKENSTQIVRDLRKEDYEREEKRLSSD